MRWFIIFLLLISHKISYGQHYLDFYFSTKEVDGSIIIYNESDDWWVFNHELDTKSATPPAATFHLFHALVALELGVINPNEPKLWNGVKNYYFGEPRPQWHCDTTLGDAVFFQNDWYFDQISQKIREKDYNFFIKESNYAQKRFSKPFPYSWNFGEFVITPKQQVDFLIGIFQQDLPFNPENQKWVTEQMNRHETEDYTLFSYEGYTVHKAEHVDWLIGVIERKGKRYFFCTRIRKPIYQQKGADFHQIKHQITFESFKILGYL